MIKIETIATIFGLLGISVIGVFNYLASILNLKPKKYINKFMSKTEYNKLKREFVMPNLHDYNSQTIHKALEHLYKELTRNIEKNIILILGQGGVGKTTLLFRFILEYTYRLFFTKRIRIAYINFVSIRDDLKDTLNNIKSSPENTILFLDGFDEYIFFTQEDEDIDIYNILETLEVNVKDFYSIVITSRKEIFDNVNKVFSKSSALFKAEKSEYSGYRIFELNDFDENQIFKVLNLKFKKEKAKVQLCMEIINNSHTIFKRPLILNFIEDFIEDINSKNKYSNIYEIYEKIFWRWFDREEQKANIRNPEKSTIFKTKLVKFFDLLTIEYYNRTNMKYDYFDIEFIKSLAAKNNININIYSLRHRPLLEFDEKKGFRCIHRSFFEFNYIKNNFKTIIDDHTCKLISDYEKTFFNCLNFTINYNNQVKCKVKGMVTLNWEQQIDFKELTIDEFLNIKNINLFIENLYDYDVHTFLKGLRFTEYLLMQINKLELPSNRLADLVFNKVLNLSSYERNKIISFENIYAFDGIQAISLNNSNIQNIQNLNGLNRLSTPIILDASNTNMVDQDLQKFIDIVSIKKLILDDNLLSNPSIILEKVSNIDELVLSNNPLISGYEKLIEDTKKHITIEYKIQDEFLYKSILNELSENKNYITYEDIKMINSIKINSISNLAGLENFTCIKSIFFPYDAIYLSNKLKKEIECDVIYVTLEFENFIYYSISKIYATLVNAYSYTMGEADYSEEHKGVYRDIESIVSKVLNEFSVLIAIYELYESKYKSTETRQFLCQNSYIVFEDYIIYIKSLLKTNPSFKELLFKTKKLIEEVKALEITEEISRNISNLSSIIRFKKDNVALKLADGICYWYTIEGDET